MNYLAPQGLKHLIFTVDIKIALHIDSIMLKINQWIWSGRYCGQQTGLMQ